MARVKMGRIFRRKNKDRRFGSADAYNLVWVENENGQEERLLMFTDAEIKRAAERAKENPEDVLKRSFLTDLTD